MTTLYHPEVERVRAQIPRDLWAAFSDLRPAEMAGLPPFAEWADALRAVDRYWYSDPPEDAPSPMPSAPTP